MDYNICEILRNLRKGVKFFNKINTKSINISFLRHDGVLWMGLFVLEDKTFIFEVIFNSGFSSAVSCWDQSAANWLFSPWISVLRNFDAAV